VERLRDLPDLALSEFGTRRRHGFLWPRWCVEALKEGLGRAVHRHFQRAAGDRESDLEAIGTDAHELPMVLAALAESDAEVATAPWRSGAIIMAAIC
jgi:nicotinate phosphoribosyltransferase